MCSRDILSGIFGSPDIIIKCIKWLRGIDSKKTGIAVINFTTAAYLLPKNYPQSVSFYAFSRFIIFGKTSLINIFLKQ